MLQNARVAARTVSELFRENHKGGGGELPPSQIRVKTVGYFRKRAPSCIFDRMFDRNLNVILPNNLS